MKLLRKAKGTLEESLFPLKVLHFTNKSKYLEDVVEGLGTSELQVLSLFAIGGPHTPVPHGGTFLLLHFQRH